MTFKIGQVGDLLRGGKGDFRPDSAFTPKQLAKGKRHEKEHTFSGLLAKEIAKDHLTEDPAYYTKLEKIEKKADADSKARNKDKPKEDLAPNKTNLLQISMSTKQIEDAIDSVGEELGTIEKDQQQTGEQLPLNDEHRRQKLVNQQSALRKVFRQRQFNITEDLTAGEMQELADGFNIVPYDPLATKKAFELGQPDIKDDRLFENPTEKKPAIQPHELAKKIPTVNPLANSDNSDQKRTAFTGPSDHEPVQTVMQGSHGKIGVLRDINQSRLAAINLAQRSIKMALFNPQEVAVNMFFEGITDDLVKNGFYVENPVEFFVGAFNEMRAALMGDAKTAADGFPDWVVNACRTFARKHELFKEATKHNFQFARAKTADFSQLQPVNPMQEQKITPPQAGAINPVRMEKRQDIIDALLPYAQGITAKPDGEIKITMPDYTQEQQNLGMSIPQSNEEQMARAKAQQFSEQSLQASQSKDPSNPAGGAPGASMPEGGPNDSGQPMPGAEAGETPMGGGSPDVSKLMQILSGSQMQG